MAEAQRAGPAGHRFQVTMMSTRLRLLPALPLVFLAAACQTLQPRPADPPVAEASAMQNLPGEAPIRPLAAD